MADTNKKVCETCGSDEVTHRCLDCNALFCQDCYDSVFGQCDMCAPPLIKIENIKKK